MEHLVMRRWLSIIVAVCLPLLLVAAYNAPSVAPLKIGSGAVSLVGPTEIFVCTSTCTVTPPSPHTDFQFCVMNDDNVSTVITLGALGGSIRYEATARTSYGTAGTGTLTSGGAVGDAICIVAKDTTHYLTVNFTGTWTAS